MSSCSLDCKLKLFLPHADFIDPDQWLYTSPADAKKSLIDQHKRFIFIYFAISVNPDSFFFIDNQKFFRNINYKALQTQQFFWFLNSLK